MIDPLGKGLEADVSFMAGAACLAAKKGLQCISYDTCTYGYGGDIERYNPRYIPEGVSSHGLHEVLSVNIRKETWLSHNTSIGEEDI